MEHWTVRCGSGSAKELDKLEPCSTMFGPLAGILPGRDLFCKLCSQDSGVGRFALPSSLVILAQSGQLSGPTKGEHPVVSEIE